MKTEQKIKEEAIALYETASPELKKLLESKFGHLFFEKRNVDIDYALDFLKITKNQALQKKILLFENPQNKRERYLNAVSLLPLIAEKINEGWKADWNNSNQYKYSPYFYKESGGWVASGDAYCFYFYHSRAGVGSYFETEEKAVKAGKEWIDLYVDILNYTTK